MNNTCSIRVTAAAGTNLARAFLSSTLILLEKRKGFTITTHLLPPQRLAGLPDEGIVQDSLLQAMHRHFSKPVVADPSLKAAKHRGLELAIIITNYHNTVGAVKDCAFSFKIIRKEVKGERLWGIELFGLFNLTFHDLFNWDYPNRHSVLLYYSPSRHPNKIGASLHVLGQL